MPVSNPPFPYFQSQLNDVLLFSSGHVSGNVNRGRALYIEAASGYDVSGTNYGGELYLRSGYGVNSTTNPSQGGNVYLKAGGGGRTNGVNLRSYGGTVNIEGGYGGITNGSRSNGGGVYIRGGNAYAVGYFGNGGGVILYGGNANEAGGTSNNAGNIQFNAGYASNGNQNFGGDIIINSGGVNGVSATDEAGYIHIYAANATTHGKGGKVVIKSGTGVDGNGLVYLKNIPAVDPGKSGALFTTAGVLHISP